MKRTVAFLLSIFFSCSFLLGFVGCKKEENKRHRYEITAEYMPDTQTVTGTVKLTWQNHTDTGVDALKFNLWANAYREDAAYQPVSAACSSSAYYAGRNYGGMDVTSAHGGKSWEIVGEDANILCVYMEDVVYPGEEVTVDLGFSTRLAKVNHRTGVTKHAVNLGNFFPILCAYGKEGFVENPYYSVGDPFRSDTANYRVTFTAPKEYGVAFSGSVTEQKTLGSKNEYTVSLANARDFAIVMSEEFKTERCKVGNTDLVYYYYDDETPAAHLAAAKESFSYYSSAFGEYPYETYSVVQTGFCHGGMEYPGLVMIGDRLQKEDFLYTIAHETAHQWWYAAVGSDQVNEAWQDEGLAEYSTALFFENHPAYGITERALCEKATENYRSYYDVYGRVFGTADTRMSRPLNEFISEYEYASVSYDKGLILFHTLRTSIGEKRFLNGLKRYYKQYCFKNARPADLIGCFEKTGVDIAGLFSSFLEGKAVI